MTSGWRAAVVANTCLSNSTMTSHALDFYAQRERDVYAECQELARGYFRDAATFHRTPFWDSRAGESSAAHGESAGISAAHQPASRRDAYQAAPVGGAPVRDHARYRRARSRAARRDRAAGRHRAGPVRRRRESAGARPARRPLRRRAGHLFCLSRARGSRASRQSAHWIVAARRAPRAHSRGRSLMKRAALLLLMFLSRSLRAREPRSSRRCRRLRRWPRKSPKKACRSRAIW